MQSGLKIVCGILAVKILEQKTRTKTESWLIIDRVYTTLFQAALRLFKMPVYIDFYA